MNRPISEGDLLWQPSEQMKQQTNMAQFMRWLEQTKGVPLRDSTALWEWSVSDLEAFWEAIWQETSSLMTSRRWGVQTGKRWMSKLARISSNPCKREGGQVRLK